MLCFDKLKIVTSTKNIKYFDENNFEAIFKNRKLQYYKYKQTIPCELLILINYEKDELVIEFTSKISGVSFLELINEETITSCLLSIKPFLEFNKPIRTMLNYFDVLKCDVTKDVYYNDVSELERYVKSNLSNYDKWKCEKYRGGFVLKNVVKTSRYKKRLIIYDKEKEVQKVKNKEIVEKLNFDGLVEESFSNTVRFEMNINTKVQIRNLLKIADNKLTNVLTSQANPILDLLNEVLKEIPVNSAISTLKMFQYDAVLKICDYDLSKVEAEFRSRASKNTSITKVMKPYRELYQRLQNNKEPAFDIRKLVE